MDVRVISGITTYHKHNTISENTPTSQNTTFQKTQKHFTKQHFRNRHFIERIFSENKFQIKERVGQHRTKVISEIIQWICLSVLVLHWITWRDAVNSLIDDWMFCCQATEDVLDIC